jgi:phosphoenolpyruvate synthase/pyruvate phosphate dikinase
VAEAVRRAYADLCSGGKDLPVAVRSSTVAEDGERASLYTPQAVAYRSRLDVETATRASMTGVGVQLMVDALASGVVFMVSSRTGDRSVAAVNASWGLGQAVVAGEATPDECWVSKVGPTLTSSTIAPKGVRCVPAPHGRGVVDEPVPVELQDVACLDQVTLFALVELALRVEDHYGSPQDIEWALARPPDVVRRGRSRTVVVVGCRAELSFGAGTGVRDVHRRSRRPLARPMIGT